MEKLYKIEEVAQMLRLSTSCIYKKVESGEIKSLKIGTAVRFTEANISDYIDKCKKPNHSKSNKTADKQGKKNDDE